jgi:hypothetical protein
LLKKKKNGRTRAKLGYKRARRARVKFIMIHGCAICSNIQLSCYIHALGTGPSHVECHRLEEVLATMLYLHRESAVHDCVGLRTSPVIAKFWSKTKHPFGWASAEKPRGYLALTLLSLLYSTSTFRTVISEFERHVLNPEVLRT